MIGQYHDMFSYLVSHKTGLITVHQKLAYETIFSYAFCDWIIILLNTYFYQLAGISYGVQSVCSLIEN